MDDSASPPPSPKKFFDITPPEQVTPSATSRPIIISNKPEQTDQMLQAPSAAPEASAQPEPTNPPVNLTPPATIAEPPTQAQPSSEPAPPPEPAPAVQVVSHKTRFGKHRHWLWLVPAIILIIVILNLLQHYGKL